VDTYLAKRTDGKNAFVGQDNSLLGALNLRTVSEADVLTSNEALRAAMIKRNDPGIASYPTPDEISNLYRRRGSGFELPNNAEYCFAAGKLIVTVHEDKPWKAKLLTTLGFIQDCRGIDTRDFRNLPSEAGSRSPYDFFTVRKDVDGSYKRGDL
jgi:hypothetical protein